MINALGTTKWDVNYEHVFVPNSQNSRILWGTFFFYIRILGKCRNINSGRSKAYFKNTIWDSMCLILPYVLPYPTLCLTLPYLTFYLTLPYVSPYHTLPYVLPYLICYLTLHYLTNLTPYLTSCPFLTCYHTLPYLTNLTSYLSSYLTVP